MGRSRAEFLDRAGQGVGARRADRRGISLRLQPVSGTTPGRRLWLSGRFAGSALARAAFRPSDGNPPDDPTLVRHAAAGRRWGVLPTVAIWLRPGSVPAVRAPWRAGHFLYSSVGSRPHSAEVRGALVYAVAALWRAAAHRATADAAVDGVSLHDYARHGRGTFNRSSTSQMRIPIRSAVG